MQLTEVFEATRSSVVAIASRIEVASHPGAPRPAFPQILGTGFVVDDRGLIVTNRHVAEALLQLPRHPVTGAFAGTVLYFDRIVRNEAKDSLGVARLDIYNVAMLDRFEASKGDFYGEKVPDLAVLQVNTRGLPVLPLVTTDWTWTIGRSIATIGFPIGRDALVVFDRLNQITPFLRSGLISSVYPFPCALPHGFCIDILSQGGASGSPILLADAPAAVGILFAGFPGVNITMGIPAPFIKGFVEEVLRSVALDFNDTQTLDELRARARTNPEPA